MDRTMRNLRALWRAESIVADVRLRQFVTRVGLRTAAAALGLFGLMMANIAVFFALQQVWGPIWAAAAIGGFNIALALILFVVAARIDAGRELDLAMEVRNLALQELEVDARALQTQFVGLRDEVIGMKQSLGSFIRHPLDAALPQLLVPLAGLIIKSLRKSTPKE
jgi:hypothetical protein